MNVCGRDEHGRTPLEAARALQHPDTLPQRFGAAWAEVNRLAGAVYRRGRPASEGAGYAAPASIVGVRAEIVTDLCDAIRETREEPEPEYLDDGPMEAD
jgi:hypothetical protein